MEFGALYVVNVRTRTHTRARAQTHGSAHISDNTHFQPAQLHHVQWCVSPRKLCMTAGTVGVSAAPFESAGPLSTQAVISRFHTHVKHFTATGYPYSVQVW